MHKAQGFLVLEIVHQCAHKQIINTMQSAHQHLQIYRTLYAFDQANIKTKPSDADGDGFVLILEPLGHTHLSMTCSNITGAHE